MHGKVLIQEGSGPATIKCARRGRTEDVVQLDMGNLGRRDFVGICASATVALAAVARSSSAAARPTLVAVESSSIAAIGYDARLRLLEIAFRTGAHYRYREVPADVHAELMRADSKGRYFGKRIRGKFAFVRAADRRL